MLRQTPPATPLWARSPTSPTSRSTSLTLTAAQNAPPHGRWKKLRSLRNAEHPAQPPPQRGLLFSNSRKRLVKVTRNRTQILIRSRILILIRMTTPVMTILKAVASRLDGSSQVSNWRTHALSRRHRLQHPFPQWLRPSLLCSRLCHLQILHP